MSKTRQVVARKLVTLAIGSMGLALPATASADFLDFTVDEGAVGGPTVGNTLTADILNGGYTEFISFDVAGNFTATAVADFTAFRANEGGDGVFSQLGSPNCTVSTPQNVCNAMPTYAIYAVFTSTGVAIPGPDPGTTEFIGNSADVQLYLDRNQDTTKTPGGVTGANGDDELILSSNLLLEGGGRLVPPGSPGFPAGGGNFSLVFGNLILSPFGQMYFPSMSGLTLTAITSGDFNFFQPVGQQTVTGDLSVGFSAAAVPEPLTLSLFGMSLLGTGIAVRRRRRNAALQA